MFNKISVLFLALAASPCFSHKDEGAAREGFMEALSKRMEASSGNLRRKLATEHQSLGGDFDACHLVAQHFGDDFLSKTQATGSCTCSGDLTDMLSLDCDFENVCDDTGIMCASIDVNVTLNNILDEDGRFGKDPKMDVASCIDTHLDFLEKMCLKMDFAKPDFFLPSHCSFSYGDEECICKVDKTSSNIPCYSFDCSKVAPSAAMARVLVSDSCKPVDLSGKNDVSMFFPAFSGLPKDEPTHTDSYEHADGLTSMEAKFAVWAHNNAGN